MPRICAHCRHVRKDEEVAPEWQCPACGRAYVKAGDSPRGAYSAPGVIPLRRESRGGRGKWLLLLAVAGAALWIARPMWLGADTPATESTRYGQPEVVLYSTAWCGYCKAARGFFDENRIRYTEHDIENTATGRDGHRRLGGQGVPLIVVGDTVIHGYDEAGLRQQLGPWLKGS